MLSGIKVPLAGWDGIPVLIDVCEYTLAERSVRMGCGGRSEVFCWLRTRARALYVPPILQFVMLL